VAELGQQLREARQARGLSIDDVALGTRIRPAYVHALEEERFADLPAPVYVRGFVRNYATFLGLDAEELIGALEKEQSGAFQPPHRHTPQQISVPVWHGPSPRAMVGTLLLVLLVAFIAFIFRQYSEFTASRSTSVFAATPSPTPITQAATAVPIPTVTPIPTLSAAAVATPPAAATKPPIAPTTAAHLTATPPPPPPPSATPQPTATQAAPLVLSLQALGDSWVRVTVDGKIAFEGTLLPGTTRAWNGATFITVRYGNAGGVSVTFNGKSEGVVGQPGQVVERTYRLG
jgi:cytoskeleton protein RodZ